MQTRIFKHARILIIDDEPANVELLQRLLERAGFAQSRNHDRTPPGGGAVRPATGRT